MSGEPWSGVSSSGLSGVREAARAHSLVRNRRDPSAWPSSGKDQGYKPMVKSLGGQRESDGVVVPLIGVQQNTPVGKDPHFGRACREGKRKGMAETAQPNHPGGRRPVGALPSEMARSATRGRENARELQRKLSVVAKRSPARRCRVLDKPRGDVLWLARSCEMAVGCVAAPGRPSVSRVRENRTHGLKGGCGNRPVLRELRH